MKQSVVIYAVVILFAKVTFAISACPDQSERLALRAQHLNAQLTAAKERCPGLADRINSLTVQLSSIATLNAAALTAPSVLRNTNRISPAQMSEPDRLSGCDEVNHLLTELEAEDLQGSQNSHRFEDRVTALYNEDPACTSTADTQASNGNNFLRLLAIGGGALLASSLTDHIDTTTDPVIPYNETDNSRNHNSRRREPPDSEDCTGVNCQIPENEPAERLDLDLLVIAQTGFEAQANNVVDSFFTHPVFSCLRRNRFKTEVVEESPLNCTIVYSNNLSSTISCNQNTFELANELRRRHNAKTVLVIVNSSSPAGTFHPRSFAGSNHELGPVSVMTTSLHRQGGVHEILHAVGFRDDYSANNPPRRGGTIMNNLLYGYIPRAWNTSIINFFGIEEALPECGSQTSQ